MKTYLPLLFACLLVAGCSSTKKAKRIYGDAFFSHWTHSHEEDMDGKRVYRPAGYDFPLSRGRDGFELKPEGALVYHAIAPGDGNVKQSGSWKLKDKNILVFTLDGKESFNTIVSVSDEKLILQP